MSDSLSQKRKSNVFIIEDDQPIGEVLSELLMEEGYEVTTATNGEEALKILRKTQQMPDLILLDLMMPVKDGIQFRKEQLQDPRLAKIPVVVMSADRNIKQKLEAMEGKDYIKKPLSIDALLQTVSQYCSPG